MISSRYHSNCAFPRLSAGSCSKPRALTRPHGRRLLPAAFKRRIRFPALGSASVSPLRLGRDGRLGIARRRFSAAPALWMRPFPAVFVIAFAMKLWQVYHPFRRLSSAICEKQRKNSRLARNWGNNTLSANSFFAFLGGAWGNHSLGTKERFPQRTLNKSPAGFLRLPGV